MAKNHRTNAVVIATTTSKATIQVSHTDKTDCDQCQQRSTCQSLSISHFLLVNESTYLPQPQKPNRPYCTGETLTLAFPSSLMQSVLVSLLGLPLMGFILGIALAQNLGEITSFLLATLLACAIFYLSKPTILKIATRKIRVFRQS